jgi:hypothetical protein
LIVYDSVTFVFLIVGLNKKVVNLKAPWFIKSIYLY